MAETSSQKVAIPADAQDRRLLYVSLSSVREDEPSGQVLVGQEDGQDIYRDTYGRIPTVALAIEYVSHSTRHQELDDWSDTTYSTTSRSVELVHFPRSLFTQAELRDIGKFRLIDRGRRARAARYFEITKVREHSQVVLVEDDSSCYETTMGGEERRIWGCRGREVQKTIKSLILTVEKKS
jgi:hypothetical protein